MATKTLTITEDAYDILKSRKKERESFSDVIRREFSSRGLRELAGILSKKDAAELEKNIRKGRKGMDERFSRFKKELDK